MLAWQQIDTVLLDIGRHPDGPAFRQLLLATAGAGAVGSGTRPGSGQRTTGAGAGVCRGGRHANWYCLDHWRRELGLDILALKRQIVDKIGWRQNAQAFLQALRASGRRCYLFTNAHPDSLALKLEQTGLDRYLDGLIRHTALAFPRRNRPAGRRCNRRWPSIRPARCSSMTRCASCRRRASSASVTCSASWPRTASARPSLCPAFAAIHHYTELLPDLQAAAGNA